MGALTAGGAARAGGGAASAAAKAAAAAPPPLSEREALARSREDPLLAMRVAGVLAGFEEGGDQLQVVLELHEVAEQQDGEAVAADVERQGGLAVGPLELIAVDVLVAGDRPQCPPWIHQCVTWMGYKTESRQEPRMIEPAFQLTALAAAAGALVWASAKAIRRVELSLAKHPSLTLWTRGGSRIVYSPQFLMILFLTESHVSKDAGFRSALIRIRANSCVCQLITGI
jgi:hypothetical protein